MVIKSLLQYVYVEPSKLNSTKHLRSVVVVVLNCKKLEKEKEKLAALEKQHGVTGFAELQSRLEEVSGNSS